MSFKSLERVILAPTRVKHFQTKYGSGDRVIIDGRRLHITSGKAYGRGNTRNMDIVAVVGKIGEMVVRWEKVGVDSLKLNRNSNRIQHGMRRGGKRLLSKPKNKIKRKL